MRCVPVLLAVLLTGMRPALAEDLTATWPPIRVAQGRCAPNAVPTGKPKKTCRAAAQLPAALLHRPDWAGRIPPDAGRTARRRRPGEFRHAVRRRAEVMSLAAAEDTP